DGCLRPDEGPGQPARAKDDPLLSRHGARGSGLVRGLESFELLVAALDGLVERFLGALLAAPDLLELLVDDGADLQEVAEPDAARLVGRLPDHLIDGDVGTGILLVEAALLGELERRRRDRQV